MSRRMWTTSFAYEGVKIQGRARRHSAQGDAALRMTQIPARPQAPFADMRSTSGRTRCTGFSDTQIHYVQTGIIRASARS